MKNVYANKELCHVWANEKQESARGSNMFFENGIIYSYGKHFPIAKIYEKGNFGINQLVLFTSRSYSSTTAKHKSFVWGSISHMDSVVVPHVIINDDQKLHQENLDELLSRINDDIACASRAIKNGMFLLESASSLMIDFQNYVKFFTPLLSKEHKKALDSFIKSNYIPASLIEKCKENQLKAQAQEELRALRARELEQEDLQAWVQGADKRRNFTSTALRIKDGYIETTKGARVTVKAGKLLYAMIQAGKDIKGYDIEGYTVISINGTLKIGCHEISIAEVHRIGALLV